MRNISGWTCVVAMVLVVCPAMAQSPDDLAAMKQRMEQMENHIRSMQDKIDEQAQRLEKQQAQLREQDENTRLAGLRAADVDAVVQNVLNDAGRRSQLLGVSGEGTAGYSNGFFISAGDAFMLRIRGLLMIRYTQDIQNNGPDDGDRGGFELARTRFGFFGHVIDPSWQFVLWTGYNTEGGTALLDTYVKKTFKNGLSVTAGQYKMPFWREWLISETRLPMSERSLLNRFSGNYVQGVMLGYEKDAIHAYLSASDGLGSINTPTFTEDTEAVAVTGRVEWLATGSWSQYSDAEAWPGKPLLVLAAAGHYQCGEYGTSRDEANIFRWTADATVKLQKFSALAVVLGNHQSNTGSVDQYGAMLQLGYFLTDNMEAHVRYEWGNSDLPGEDDLSIITLGIDHHWAQHQVRLVVDIGYAFNGVSSFWASPLSGYRADAAGENGQIVVRTQLELNF